MEGPRLSGVLTGSEEQEYVPGVDIRVLGPVDVRVDGESVQLGGPKQRALFALLVAGGPGVVSVDVLIEGLWGEQQTSGARSTLQTYVSNLRQALGGHLVHERGGYRLEADPESVDAVRFEAILEESYSRLTIDSAATAGSLRQALGLWRGRPYADLIDVPGLEPEARRLEELRLEAVELRIEADLASGLHGTLVAELDALAEEHPTREHFRAQHMLALYRSGRQAEALRGYRRTESFLAEELGVEPSKQLQELELKILAQDESLLAGAGRVVTQRLAFLVTDIEGSTRLWDSYPQDMAEALATHDRVLRKAIEQENGRVFKHTGDGLLAAFSDTVAAVTAAEGALRNLAASDWGVVGELKVRMGIDVGEADNRGGDFFGPPLNRATRLCAIAHGGQVLVSSSAYSELSAGAPAGLQIRHLGEVRLRGLATPELVAQLVFVGLQADFPELRIDAESDLTERLDVLSVPGYEVRDRVGEGSFGVVWRAYQPSVGREVAIKMIRPELASQPSFIRRFEAEARTMARLAHPHIVPLIDFWRDSQSAYLVLGMLPGGSLAGAMGADVPDRSLARKVLGQIAEALDHAHSQGLVHGDLKPANVLLDGAGNAYLSDFGLTAQLLYPEMVSSCSTNPAYRAPEETETGPSSAGDRYALGVLARALLGDDPELDPVLTRATAERPGDRFESAAAFIADLDRVMGTEPDLVPEVVSRNPYKGLRAFEEGDAADFFGRDELIATLLAALSEHRFVTVVGPSGSGKSSVVLAGLLPRLASGALGDSATWARVVLSPGSDPMAALAAAVESVSTESLDPEVLTKKGLEDSTEGELLIVIDQFEELYTQTESLESRNRFIGLVTEAVSDPQGSVRVVATLRADFYGRPLASPELGRLVRDGLVTVLAPTRDELVEMIVAPSQAVGLRWEPGLPHRIVEDVAHQPGGMPLLQYALTDLVERRSGDLLTAADYERVHGVTGALAARAESLYRDLNPAQQDASRQVLLRLVTVDEESDDTRRRVRRTELELIGISRADLEAVLDAFTSQRLLLADRDPATRGPTVEVAHEALLREWPRLSSWVDQQREALILGRRFRAALGDWEAAGQHEDYLLTGSRLAPFIGWADTASLTTDEQGFYRASRERDERERSARRRRRRTLVGVLVGATLVASTLGIFAVLQAQRATGEAERALAAEGRAGEEAERASAAAERASAEAERARASELAASALNALDTDPSLAKLLAVASAMTAEPTIDAMSVLHQTLAEDRVIGRYTWPDAHEAPLVLWTDLSPDGTRLVAAGSDGTSSTYLEVYDFETNQAVWSYQVEDPRIVIDRPIYSEDGLTIVAGLLVAGGPKEGIAPDQLGAFSWDAETGELLHRIDLGPCGGTVPEMTDQRMLATSIGLEDDGSCAEYHGAILMAVDLESSEHTILTSAVRFLGYLSGDGRYAAFEDVSDPASETSIVVDVETGDRVLEFDPYEHEGVGFGTVRDLNNDGSLLLAGDRPMVVWDVAAGEIVSRFDGHSGEVFYASFSASGDSVISSGRDGTVRQWDALTGEETAVFQSVGAGNVSEGESGRLLVTESVTRTARLIDTKPILGEVWGLPTCGGFVYSNTLSITGGHAALSELCPSGVTETEIVHLPSRELASTIPGHQGQHLSVSPDGAMLLRQENPCFTPEAEESPPSFCFNEGESLGGDFLGPPRIRRIGDGKIVSELEGVCVFDNSFAGDYHDYGSCVAYPETPFPMWAWQSTWSSDGTLVAIANPLARAVSAWDVTTGELLGGYAGCEETGAEDVIFAPDDEYLVIFCTDEGRIVSVSTDTWQAQREVVLPEASEGVDRRSFVGYVADDTELVAVGGSAGFGGGSLHWLDARSLEDEYSVERATEGTPKSWALSPSGSLIAIGASDGFIKVWDAESRDQIHEIYLGETQVQGLAFVDDSRLAVAPQEGGLHVYTLDASELLQIVRSSLTRGFTPAECERFGFANECPTLEEMKSGDGVDS